MQTPHVLSLTALCLAAGLHAEAPTPMKPIAPAALPQATLALKADLLLPGKTQGTFRLTGLVRKDRTVVLRWANDAGEMPTEGVRVFRQKVGETSWKDLTGRRPVGYLQGRFAEKRLDEMKSKDPEKREGILAYPFGDVQYDPSTRIRLVGQPSKVMTRAKDLTAERSLQEFRSLRAAGRLCRSDLQLMTAGADMDTDAAEALGLMYTDDPGRGEYRYKIVIALLEGGSVEVACDKTFDIAKPTPVPQPINFTAASGNGEVLLNWDETPSDVVGGYNVYRAETANGPWKRINQDPVKHVELDVEDPELVVRRSLGTKAAVDRMLKPLPLAARTPQKILEANQKAQEQMQNASVLPTLSPAVSKDIQSAVTAGRLRPGGVQAARSIYTDSRRTAGNSIQDEHTYYYKVAALDLGGLEQPMDTAPVVPGIPKDLEAPKVPGRPMLKAEVAARGELRKVQVERIKNLSNMAPSQVAMTGAAAAKAMPTASPLAGSGAFKPGSPLPALASSGLPAHTAEAKHERLVQALPTIPILALKQLGESSILRSNLDGTVPPAQLAWAPSPDGDLKSYQLYRAKGKEGFTKIADTTSPEWTDTGLEAGQAYRYGVKAVDRLGNVSAMSTVGVLEVSDSSLPGRLALNSVKGQVTKDIPSAIPIRSFLPQIRVPSTASLKGAKAFVELKASKVSVVGPIHAPKASMEPKVRAYRPAVSLNKTALAKDLITVQPVEVKASALPVTVKSMVKFISRAPNPMLAISTPAKELHVLLEWNKPLQGFPMDYVVQVAPQKMDFVSSARPKSIVPVGFTAFQGAKVPSSASALHASAVPHVTTIGKVEPKSSLVLNRVADLPELHTPAMKGVVAIEGAGLRESAVRLNNMAVLVPKAEPGAFTRVNEAPLTVERYVVTFPADAAQYGGATFYFRVQAFTKEFGRRVEGPVSAPIAVRLPDVVPPPSPAVGSADLQEVAGNALNVALTWTQTQVKDLAGVLVDRQPMNYTVVEGEAKPGTPAGPAERLTANALAGLTFKDVKAPAGYQRYTLRSVDQDGNVSNAVGYLDMLVPGEPVPGTPEQLAAAGGKLTWQAAANTAGYTVWCSFTGKDDDWECISGILGASQTSFAIPTEGTLHLRVVARSVSGMNTTPSASFIRTP